MTDPMAMFAARFPLVARPRPACTPLAQRATDLHQRAESAADCGDLAAATAVFNLAALLASDCGNPSLARRWAQRLARTTLDRDPADGRQAINSLEPVINLARLHIRAGHGTAAWDMLEHLQRAISTSTDTVIDDVAIPARRLTREPDVAREVRRFMWATLLATGARALATAGRWTDARQRLSAHHGIGARMLDGRQIAVIAHLAEHQPDRAASLLHTTQPGEPWEHAVGACLQLVTDHQQQTALNASLGPTAVPHPGRARDGLAVFRTRLALTAIETFTAAGHPAAPTAIRRLLAEPAEDGYAAREILASQPCRYAATDPQLQQLADLVTACGLDVGHVPQPDRHVVEAALDIAERVLRHQPQPIGVPLGSPA